jgi:hypothetical protein
LDQLECHIFGRGTRIRAPDDVLAVELPVGGYRGAVDLEFAKQYLRKVRVREGEAG